MWLSATSLCVVPDLEATKKRLLDSEREKGELVTQYQQRVEEVEYLKRWACLHLLKSLIHIATVTQEFVFSFCRQHTMSCVVSVGYYFFFFKEINMPFE